MVNDGQHQIFFWLKGNGYNKMMNNACYFAVFFQEEMSDLKGQLKLLESNNMEYMQKNLDLEEVCHEIFFTRKVTILLISDACFKSSWLKLIFDQVMQVMMLYLLFLYEITCGKNYVGGKEGRCIENTT